MRWIENHGRPTTDLAGASIAADVQDEAYPVGASELWVVPSADYRRLPHRPLFRPSPPARRLLDAFARSVGWTNFGRYTNGAGGVRRLADWQLLSDTRALDGWKREARLTGFFERLRPGEDFILLGLVIEGGQGLVTADDRHFLGAIDGTREADEARTTATRYAELLRQKPAQRVLFDREIIHGLEHALLAVAAAFKPDELPWPRSGLVRVAPADSIRRTRLTEAEVRRGISAGPNWVPFEKGDSSGDDGGAVRWCRENPVAIDWSEESVELLRRRARQAESYRKPRLQNEHLWGQGGVTWNRVASYLRARRVPDGGIFSDMAPTINPTVPWLTIDALLALVNSSISDFALRTLLGSRMHVEIGNVRRLPIPVLTPAQCQHLEAMARRAVAARSGHGAGEAGECLEAIETEINHYVADLYGIAADADLWVVR